MHGTSYAGDLTDEQWALLEPVFNAPGKRGPEHAPDLRRVVDAMLYISHTGCQWRFLPESFGPWTRVWSQFRRWSRNGTWARALTVLHKAAREAVGRTEATPSMVVAERRELVLVDRGVTAASARRLGRRQGLEVRRVGWDDKQPVFRPIRHAWRVEVAHGRLGRARRLATSFQNTTSATGWLQIACIATTLRQLSVDAVAGSLPRRRRRPLPARSSRHVCESPRIV